MTADTTAEFQCQSVECQNMSMVYKPKTAYRAVQATVLYPVT